MNTVETNNVGSAKIADQQISVAAQQQRIAKLEAAPTNAVDVYTGRAANDAFAAQAFSNILKNASDKLQLSRSESPGLSASPIIPLKALKSNELLIDEASMRDNIVGFVQKKLAAYANSDAKELDLSALKSEAIKGVKDGFSKAIEELALDDNEQLSNKLRESFNTIVEQIEKLPNALASYQRSDSSDERFNSVELKLKDSATININFAQELVFQEQNEEQSNLSEKFTAKSSNLSFEISSTASSAPSSDIAEYVNKVDELLVQFYKDDLELTLDRVLQRGIEPSKIDSSFFALEASTNSKELSTYKNVSGLSDENADSLQRDIKRVAKYKTDMQQVLKSTFEIFESQNEFKQVINGLVNQMKDVQVPDLLQAINRFHSFNERLS